VQAGLTVRKKLYYLVKFFDRQFYTQRKVRYRVPKLTTINKQKQSAEKNASGYQNFVSGSVIAIYKHRTMHTAETY
jgi:hypothetical protein